MAVHAPTPVIAALLAGAVAGYGIAIPVGAVGAYLVSLSARTSLRIGAGAALGVATADGSYALLATLGGAAVADALRPVLTPLRLVSALVLLALAGWSAVRAVQAHRAPAGATVRATVTSARRAYFGFWGLTMLNPATVVYFAALVLGNNTAAPQNLVAQAGFVVAAFVASASWQLLLAGGGAALGRVLTSDRGRLVTALVSSAVIAALAVRLLV